MKKKFLITSLAALAVACGISGSAAWTSVASTTAEADTTTVVETSVTGMSWKNNGFCFGLSTTDYATASTNAIPGIRATEYNYLTDIVVYKGDESATLGEIATVDQFYNMWGEQNTYTVQVAEAWRTGVTQVVVPAGTEFPSVAYTGYTPWSADGSAVTVAPTTNEKKAFVTPFEVVFTADANGNYIAQKNVPVKETEIAVKNLHIRGEYKAAEARSHCFLIFFLSELDCVGSTVPVGSALFEYNLLSYVKLWTSETEYVTLGDAFNHEKGTKEAYYNLWGENNTVAIQLGNYHGGDFVKITIEPGCQFPSYAYTSGQSAAEKTAFVQKRAAECVATNKDDPYFMTMWRILIDNSVSEDLPVVTEEIAVRSDDFIGIQIRGGEDDTNALGNPHCFILFYLPEDLEDFPGFDATTGSPLQSAISPSRAKMYNTLDNVLLWTSETEYITLGEAYNREGGTKEMYYNIWGEENCIAYELGGYHGTSFVKITVLKGCEFPSYNFTEVELYPEVRKAYVQAATINFIDWSPDMYASTNWRADTKMGVAEVTGIEFNVSGEDNMLQLTVSGTDFPTEGALKIPTGGLEQVFPNDDFFSNIIIDGKSVSEYIAECTTEWVTAYFNYDGYGTIAFNVPGLSKDSEISSIILKKGLSIPAFENPIVSLREYRVLYYSVSSATEFTKGADGVFTKEDSVSWKVTFDGANAIKVVDGGRIPETSFPPDPVKDGYEFIGWYNGAREWRPTDRVMGDVNLVAKFEEIEDDGTTNSTPSKNEKSGCGSTVSGFGVMVLASLAAITIALKKKKQD